MPIAVVFLMLVGGVATADGLLEPGRTDRAGITLAPTVTTPEAGVPGDWYPLKGAQYELSPGSARVTPVAPGLQLISRGVPVIAEECYEIAIELEAASEQIELRLLDETGHDVLLRTSLRAVDAGDRPVTVRAPEARLSIGLAARREGSAFTLGGTRVERLPTCPENGLLELPQG